MLLLNRIPNLRGGSMESWVTGHDRDVIEIHTDGRRSLVGSSAQGNILDALCAAGDLESTRDTRHVSIAAAHMVRDQRRVVLFHQPLAYEVEEWSVTVLHGKRVAWRSSTVVGGRKVTEGEARAAYEHHALATEADPTVARAIPQVTEDEERALGELVRREALYARGVTLHADVKVRGRIVPREVWTRLESVACVVDGRTTAVGQAVVGACR